MGYTDCLTFKTQSLHSIQTIFNGPPLVFSQERLEICQEIEKSPPEWHRPARVDWLPPGDRHETLPSLSESSFLLSKSLSHQGRLSKSSQPQDPSEVALLPEEGKKQNPSASWRGTSSSPTQLTNTHCCWTLCPYKRDRKTSWSQDFAPIKARGVLLLGRSWKLYSA